MSYIICMYPGSIAGRHGRSQLKILSEAQRVF